MGLEDDKDVVILGHRITPDVMREVSEPWGLTGRSGGYEYREIGTAGQKVLWLCH